jgi:hypothetical protein
MSAIASASAGSAASAFSTTPAGGGGGGQRKPKKTRLQTHKTTTMATRCAQCHLSLKLPLRRCSGCLTVAYCSVGCQKRHWHRGHRAKCKQLQKNKDKTKHKEAKTPIRAPTLQHMTRDVVEHVLLPMLTCTELRELGKSMPPRHWLRAQLRNFCAVRWACFSCDKRRSGLAYDENIGSHKTGEHSPTAFYVPPKHCVRTASGGCDKKSAIARAEFDLKLALQPCRGCAATRKCVALRLMHYECKWHCASCCDTHCIECGGFVCKYCLSMGYFLTDHVDDDEYGYCEDQFYTCGSCHMDQVGIDPLNM